MPTDRKARTPRRRPPKQGGAKSGRPVEFEKDRLLDAAEILFARKGFEGTTVREIARHAGCNVALISYHFRGKGGIYHHVLVRYFDALPKHAEELSDQGDQSPTEQLAAYLATTLRHMLAKPGIQKIFARELLGGGQRAIATVMKSENNIYARVKEILVGFAQRDLLRSDCDIELAVLQLVSALVYCCIAGPLVRNVYGFDRLDAQFADKLGAHLSETLFHGLGRKNFPPR